ncbi:uncharacterized protein B0H64DRAFT_431971 [Chaetomium fimeti]|uniref:Uncharacterized protein n=1 Tax=Chaetomium fimeti TaxID=1854472 RepID=A0AAE0LRV2_9PEZI|nr:hypothetical protein B0H64DRAFT_431971 [Chaetomium fimeti]
MTSQPSAATLARRDAILKEFTELGCPLSKAEFEETLLEAQEMALKMREDQEAVALHADRLHFLADGTLWCCHLDRTVADFRAKYAEPPVMRGPSCPEYEPYRGRVLAKKSSAAGKPTASKTEPKAKQPGKVEDIPDEFWPEQGFEGLEDLGITKWTITLPPTAGRPVATLVPGAVDSVAAPWRQRSFVVVLGREGGRDSLKLRCRIRAGAAVPKAPAHKAWMDLVGWYYDLLAGAPVALPAWIDKAAQTRADAVPRDASSLRRLVSAVGIAEKLAVAANRFRALGMLPTDRDTGGYSYDIIGNRLEGWWVTEQFAATGLDEARYRNVGWSMWHSDAVNGTIDGRRPPNAAEAREIEQLYRQRRIGMPIVDDVVRRLLERTRGPFGSIEGTLGAIDHWVKQNPENLLLPQPYLHRVAIAALHRMVPTSLPVVNFYVHALLPAAATEFVDEACSDLSTIRDAMEHWVKANPDGHLGSVKERTEAMYNAWNVWQMNVQDEVSSLVRELCLS